MRKLYRLAEVMALLNLSHTQAYREMAAGRLAYIQRGNQRLFEDEAIDSYVASLKETATVDQILELVDEAGCVDVSQLPDGATLADLAEVKRIVTERRAVA